MSLKDRAGGSTLAGCDGSAALADTLDTVPEGLVVFDAGGKLLFWNSSYVELYDHPPGFLRVGLSCEAVMGRIARSGRVPEAVGREDAWVADRLRHHALVHHGSEHRLSDGRWIRVDERRSRHGLHVGIRVDITDLKRREASFRLLFEANPVPILVVERDEFGMLAVNDAALKLFGYDRATFLGLTVGDLCAAGRSAPLRDARPWRCIRADGAFIDLLPCSSAFDLAGRPAVITALMDMTEVQIGREALHRTRAFLDSVVDTIPSMVFAKDMQDDGRYVLYNRAGARQVGYDSRDVIGRTDYDLFEGAVAAAMRDRDREVVSSGIGQSYETSIPRADGTPRLFEMRKVAIAASPGAAPRYVLGICDDITDRREMERRIAHAARRDALTGLPNRTAFVEVLDAALAARRRQPDGVAVLSDDLDAVRQVYATLGHVTGDALLKAVAERLIAQLRGADILARLGADAFGVIQGSVAGPADAASLAERLLDGFGRPFTMAGREFRISASIGLTLVAGCEATAEPAPAEAPAPDAALRQAELALRRVKASRRGGFGLFEPRMDEEVRQRRALEQDLRDALGRGEFELFYQPQVDLVTEAITGFEALVRWRHPVRGLVAPGEFITVAEETGLIVPLGAWILARACAEAMGWPVPVRVGVNLSPVQFIAPGLMEAVAAALAGSGLPPERLELEITESVRLIDNEANLATLYRLREAGLGVALDDFGTGYASLSYLRAFPFSKIKLDRSFVSDLGSDPGCLAIVRAATRLARDLGIDTIAEGIETPTQFLQLRQIGCAAGQGYLFGRPLPAAEVAATLARRDGLPEAASAAPCRKARGGRGGSRPGRTAIVPARP